jgi:hypothetical protein
VCGAVLRQPPDVKLQPCSLGRVDLLEAATPQATSKGSGVRPKQGQARPLDVDQMAAGAQDPDDLVGVERTALLRDEVEHAIRVGERARLAPLEGDPALGVEADPADRPSHRLGGPIDAANAGCRELTGEEEDPVALPALDLQGSLGRRHVEDGGGKRRERRWAHAAMIATAGSRSIL